MVGVYGLEAKRSQGQNSSSIAPRVSRHMQQSSNSAGSRALGDLSQGPADRQIGTVIPKITMSLVIAALIYYKSTGSLSLCFVGNSLFIYQSRAHIICNIASEQPPREGLNLSSRRPLFDSRERRDGSARRSGHSINITRRTMVENQPFC